ncbi:MAG: amino acid ABC transporter permease [Acidimicrobiia bacterium]|nr:amino acid ABC transporter permease [Acidimicrobiia bacterium]
MSTVTSPGAPAPTIARHRRMTPTKWLKKNLFSNWYNSLLTIVFGAFILWVMVSLARYLVHIDTEIIRVNLKLYMTGRFPNEQLGRMWLAIYIAVACVSLLARATVLNAQRKATEAGIEFSSRSNWLDVVRRFWPIGALVIFTLSFTGTITPTLLTIGAAAIGLAAYWAGEALPPSIVRRSWLIAVVGAIAFYLALAGFGGVGWDLWQGFFLNIVLTVAGISLAFPLGLMLALGRRSTLPAVRLLSVTYIEFLRGVPMITLLLMGAFALGFLIPGDVQFSLFLRILIAITLFQSAYIAEVVRGGLQSVPKGQIEAGQSIGLSPWKTMRLIVLPQALRNVIPAMVGQFISLFKDTTLVYIVSLLDLLRATSISTAQPEFFAQGLDAVVLPFAALYFWVGSFVMSRESRRLEKKLGVGVR